MKRILMTAATALLLLAVLCAAGIAFVPSILASVDNAHARECNEYSRTLMSMLEEKMSADKENLFWYRLVGEGNSSKLVSALDNEAGGSDYASDYYIKFSRDKLQLLCKSHPRVLDVSMELPDNVVHNERVYKEPESTLVTAVHAYGSNIYFAGAPLDKENPDKMIFTDADDTNALFGGIVVTASYAGGGERVLNADEYKIRPGVIDMAEPGRHGLVIEYNNMPWHTMRTSFEINVLANDRRSPLKVSSGSGDAYEINYWDWMDYFADSLDAPGRQYMDFSPSVVRDDGRYYYFPDGLAVMKDSEYNSSIAGARDKKVHDKQAYHVEIDPFSEVYTTDAPDEPKAGSLRAGGENADEIYVWLDEKTDEFAAGWVQVFGEVTHVENKE